MKKHKKTTKRRVKKEFNKKLFVFIFLIIAIFGFMLYSSSSKKDNLLSSSTPTPTLSPYTFLAEVSYIPDYKGKKALYIQAEEGSFATNYPGESKLIFEDINQLAEREIDQNLLKGAIRLFNRPSIDGEIISFAVEGNNMYFSTYNPGYQGGERTTSIYKMDLSTKKPKLLWTNWLDSTRYQARNYIKSQNLADIKGYVEIMKVEGNYMMLTMYGCAQCETGEAGRLFINLNNMKEKIISGGVNGNINMNVKEGKITYQELKETKIKCDEIHYERGFECEGGMTEGVEPSGDILSEPLP